MAEKKKPPSAIALAVSVAHASQLPVLSLLQVETSVDPKKPGLGNVMGLRWATTVDHMEEILKADPEQGHALMVTLPPCYIDSFLLQSFQIHQYGCISLSSWLYNLTKPDSIQNILNPTLTIEFCDAMLF